MRPVNILIFLIAALMLGGMMMTTPGYNQARAPFITTVPFDQQGQTRLFGGRFLDWRTADRIEMDQFGTKTTRDTEGVFLIVDLMVTGTSETTVAEASWLGASGRRYDATKRVTTLPGQLDLQWLQPGIEAKTFTVFELPPDEVQGGGLLLSHGFPRPLDGVLRLEGPATAPKHETVVRLGE